MAITVDTTSATTIAGKRRCADPHYSGAAYPLAGAIISYGRIISLSSCSRM